MNGIKDVDSMFATPEQLAQFRQMEAQQPPQEDPEVMQKRMEFDADLQLAENVCRPTSRWDAKNSRPSLPLNNRKWRSSLSFAEQNSRWVTALFRPTFRALYERARVCSESASATRRRFFSTSSAPCATKPSQSLSRRTGRR